LFADNWKKIKKFGFIFRVSLDTESNFVYNKERDCFKEQLAFGYSGGRVEKWQK